MISGESKKNVIDGYKRSESDTGSSEVQIALLTERLSELCLTTNHVVFESITLARGSLHHRAAVEMGERLYDESMARIHWATPEEEYEAFEYLKRYDDKEYSSIDCLSFVIMEKHDIKEALTVDRDFTHRFIARPGPR